MTDYLNLCGLLDAAYLCKFKLYKALDIWNQKNKKYTDVQLSHCRDWNFNIVDGTGKRLQKHDKEKAREPI